MEKKETTASEVSQMEEEERERGSGWKRGRRRGEGEWGGGRSQLVLAILPLFLSLLTVRRDHGDHGNVLIPAICGFCHTFLWLLVNLAE